MSAYCKPESKIDTGSGECILQARVLIPKVVVLYYCISESSSASPVACCTGGLAEQNSLRLAFRAGGCVLWPANPPELFRSVLLILGSKS